MPGGLLVVDVPVPSLVAAPVAVRHWRCDSYIWTLQTIHIEYDATVHQTTRFLRYDKWRNGSLCASELQVFRLQHWSGDEFAALLAEAGFVNTVVTGDYDGARKAQDGYGVWTYQAVNPGPAHRQGIPRQEPATLSNGIAGSASLSASTG